MIIWLCFALHPCFAIPISRSDDPDYPPDDPPGSVLDIGSRLELFVDDFLIDHLIGSAELRLHHPDPGEIVMVHDEPWEGSGCGYHCIFRDGEKYRMYYRGTQMTLAGGKLKTNDHPSFICYAESDDGILWYKPDLNAFEFRVEIQDENGSPVPGFTLEECPPVFGDTLERPVSWEGGSDLSSLAGIIVRLRFALRDADLYSLRFK